MKMIIVLDKICLLGVIGISLYVGYKAGVAETEVKLSMQANKKPDLHEVPKN